MIACFITTEHIGLRRFDSSGSYFLHFFGRVKRKYAKKRTYLYKVEILSSAWEDLKKYVKSYTKV